MSMLFHHCHHLAVRISRSRLLVVKGVLSIADKLCICFGLCLPLRCGKYCAKNPMLQSLRYLSIMVSPIYHSDD